MDTQYRNKKNQVHEIVESSLENEIGIIMLAEADNLDSQYLIGQMETSWS